MLGLLRLPPFLIIGIILALAAYLVYRIVTVGTAHPLTIILLILLAFVLVRVLFKMRHTAQESESDV
jgi:ABC-type siderophore export system fused ATPase/permease subunit